jgi:hypothetical protein
MPPKELNCISCGQPESRCTCTPSEGVNEQSFGTSAGDGKQQEARLGYCDRHRWLHAEGHAVVLPCMNWKGGALLIYPLRDPASRAASAREGKDATEL